MHIFYQRLSEEPQFARTGQASGHLRRARKVPNKFPASPFQVFFFQKTPACVGVPTCFVDVVKRLRVFQGMLSSFTSISGTFKAF